MMKKLRVLFVKSLLAVVFISFISCNNNEESPAPDLHYSEQLNVSYGPHERHIMDIYLPKNRTSATKVVIAVHGGGFVGGKKEDIIMAVEELVESGYAVINMHYRLVDTTGIFQEPLVHQPSAVTITEQLEDIGLAIDFALGKVDDWAVSHNQWAIFGHSAGATLALLYTHSDHNGLGQIKAVGNLAGALDFGFQDEAEFDVLDPRLVEILYRAVGAEPVNSNQLAYMARSPYWVTFNDPNPEPTINIRPENNDTGGGNADDDGKYQVYKNLLDDKKVPNQYVILMGADHGLSQAGKWQEAAQHLAGFFESHLR